ncbi:MAG: tRNA (adenosine(37)-N6)-threonylcarbamoyltransferase complex ATPase subunit type 1 TsaE [Ectothiorhodospiraceae bacterium AqS1]|nr:tRNA (adenosine(37)-N6)-threonylcarbamoyltransferase complex ATPase subunit type 1 TsaE [Ectothiorhodospiraceae bacterium AqS1]
MNPLDDSHPRPSSQAPSPSGPTLFLANEEATADAGRALAQALECEAEGSVGGSKAPFERALMIGLRGSLGAGKTTLVRSLLRGLGVAGSVRSPTYTLAEPYETRIGSVWHLDLYRMADAEELEYIGIRDLIASSTLCLIEWPDREPGERLVFDLLVDIEIPAESEDGDRAEGQEGQASRRLSFAPGSETGRGLLVRLERCLPESLRPR